MLADLAADVAAGWPIAHSAEAGTPMGHATADPLFEAGGPGRGNPAADVPALDPLMQARALVRSEQCIYRCIFQVEIVQCEKCKRCMHVEGALGLPPQEHCRMSPKLKHKALSGSKHMFSLYSIGGNCMRIRFRVSPVPINPSQG